MELKFNVDKLYKNTENYDFLIKEKIKVLVSHNDDYIRKSIVDSISQISYIDVVATASTGIDTYNKIVDLKPEIVFSEYNYNDMSGLELIKKIKDKLLDKFPNYNTIGLIPSNELKDVIHITGSKLNGFVAKPYNEGAIEIIKAYKEDKYKNGEKSDRKS